MSAWLTLLQQKETSIKLSFKTLMALSCLESLSSCKNIF